MAKSNLLEFLKFLNLVRSDSTVFAELKKKDYRSIEHFPGLTRAERAALKTFDWKHIKFSGTAKELKKYIVIMSKPGAVVVAVKTHKKVTPESQVAARKLAPPNFFVEKVTTI